MRAQRVYFQKREALVLDTGKQPYVALSSPTLHLAQPKEIIDESFSSSYHWLA